MQLPFSVLLFVGIPEGIALATLAFTLAKLNFNVKKILIIGICISLLSYLIRFLPITFGTHTIISIIFLFFVLNITEKVDVLDAIKSSLITYIMLIIFESVAVTLILYVFDLPNPIVTNNVPLRIIVGLPHSFLLLSFAYIYKRNYKKLK